MGEGAGDSARDAVSVGFADADGDCCDGCVPWVDGWFGEVKEGVEGSISRGFLVLRNKANN